MESEQYCHDCHVCDIDELLPRPILRCCKFITCCYEKIGATLFIAGKEKIVLTGISGYDDGEDVDSTFKVGAITWFVFHGPDMAAELTKGTRNNLCCSPSWWCCVSSCYWRNCSESWRGSFAADDGWFDRRYGDIMGPCGKAGKEGRLVLVTCLEGNFEPSGHIDGYVT
jgi:hypothetical protein